VQSDLPDIFIMPILVPVINHLLSQEAWARAKLAPHAGKVACLELGALAPRLAITADGMVDTAIADAPVNVTIRVALSDLPLLMQNREHAFSYVKIDGDADFANSISQVAQNLKWEAEEDLSKWVGDIAAMRIVAGAKTAADAARSTHKSLTENLAEYLTEENPILVRPAALADLAADITQTRDDVERLMKRIEKLENRGK
jgi:ubiquinone biosynthesis protein UbiJ